MFSSRNGLQRFTTAVLLGLGMLLLWPVESQAFFYSIISATPRQPHMTWEHWWEANRDAFFAEAMTRHYPRDPEPSWLRARQEALPALMQTSFHRDPMLRAASIFSLGRMGDEAVVQRILEDIPDGPVAALGDRDSAVRTAAWMALGLISNEACRATLLQPPFELLTESDYAARIIGVGLLPSLHQEEIALLLDAVENGPGDEVGRLAVWALRVHNVDEAEILMSHVVAHSGAAFAAMEALLSPRGWNSPEARALQREALTYHHVRRKLPCYAEILAWVSGVEVRRNLLDGERERFGIFLSHELFSKRGKAPPALAGRVQVAAALGLMHQPPVVNITDRRWLENELMRQMELSYFGDRPDVRGPAGLALAVIIDEDFHIEPLLKLLAGEVRAAFVMDPRDEQDPQRRARILRAYMVRDDDQGRAYGAIAIGLYLRRMHESTYLAKAHPLNIRHNRAVTNRRRLPRMLWTQFAHHEGIGDEIRPAWLLGLALSGDRTFARDMARVFDDNVARRPKLAGYALLAMGLSGDVRAGELGRWYIAQLAEGDDGLTDDEVAALRAALQGMMLVGASPDQQNLMRIWSRNEWVGLEMATMARWLEDEALQPILLAALQMPDYRLAAALSLGELFDAERPSLLSRLYLHSNFMMPFRDQQPRVPSENSRGFATFRNPKWWESDERSRLHDGWPMRFPYALSHPYLYEWLTR